VVSSQWSGQLGKTQKENFAAKGLKEPKAVFVAAFVRTLSPRGARRRKDLTTGHRGLTHSTPLRAGR
jgi:hypothetical protein